ncbi:MAG: DNA repair protein RadA, partial [Clostridia bacterium]|nr:DNA repair protein RadA [Clostridia bacterium]
NDVYLNVIGGLRLDEPASDVSVAMALISSMTDRIIPDDLIAIGELGLAGECRAVSNPEQRVKEAARLGFKHAILPWRNVEKRKLEIPGINIIPIKGIYEVLNMMKKQD